MISVLLAILCLVIDLSLVFDFIWIDIICMMNLHGLPPELKEHVFCYCTTTDLINLACCCNELRKSVVYILWKIIRIPWDVLEQKTLPKFICNIKNTYSLKLYERNDKSDEDEDGTYKSDAWLNKSVNFLKLLNCCDPNKLTKLDLVGVATNPEIENTVSVLVNLKELSLTGTSFLFDTDWKYLKTLDYLKKLSLQKCGIDDEGIENIVECKKLEELHLELCYLMRNDSLQYISTIPNLRKITLLQNSYISADAFKCFGNLDKLEYLHLESTRLDDTNLIYLCEHLKNLQVLNLGSRNITDIGFTKIGSLSFLLELNIDTCCNISDLCFSYIKDIPLLEKLSFNSTYLTDDVFSYLLQLKALRVVHITNMTHGFSDNAVDIFCKQFGLKKKLRKGSWKVSFLTLSKDI